MSFEMKSYLVEFFDEGSSKPKFEYVMAEDVSEAKHSIMIGWPDAIIQGVWLQVWDILDKEEE